MTEYLLIATHSGNWEIAKSDGTLSRGTSHYLVVCKKDKKTNRLNCKPIVIKCTEEVKLEAKNELTDHMDNCESTMINLFFDENQTATGIKVL